MYDGTYCDPNEWDGVKTVVGVCFYLAPRDSEGNIIAEYHNPNDKHTRLMVAAFNNGIGYVQVPGFDSHLPNILTTWGMHIWYEGNWGNQYSGQMMSDGTRLNIEGEPTYNIYKVKGITASSGSGPSSLADSQIRDENNLDNYGFKPIVATHHAGDGFAYQEPSSYVEARTLTEEFMHLVGEGNDYKVGDIVNSGYAKTLKIIAQRNKILNAKLLPLEETVQNEDGTITSFTLPVSIPQATGNTTELEDLLNGIVRLHNFIKEEFGSPKNQKQWAGLYYPFASVCYAYEPKVKNNEILAPKFKAHNWFAPTNGENIRMIWYKYYAPTTHKIFQKAIDVGISVVGTDMHYSCAEQHETNVSIVQSRTFNNTYKFAISQVMPICAF